MQGTDVADRTSTADLNTLKVTQTGTTDIAYGGRADVLAREDGTVASSIVSASTNGIEFNGGNYTTGIYGGYAVLNGSGSATASNNGEYEGEVDGETITHDGKLTNVTAATFVGGLASVVVENDTASTATASTNIFTLDGGKYTEAAVGGSAYVKNGTQQSDTATASGNELTLQNGAESNTFFTGGIASITGEGTALAESNKAIVNAAKSTDSITAGTATSEKGEAKALSNETSLTGGEYTSVFGGQASVTTGGTEYDAAEASRNTVVLDGGATAATEILGGYASLKGTSVADRTSTADSNILKVTQSDKTELAYGGRADVLASEGGTVANSIVSASLNSIEFDGGTYTGIYGGYAVLNGSGTATASENGAILSDATEEEDTETDTDTGTGSDSGTTNAGTTESTAAGETTTASNELVLPADETAADDSSDGSDGNEDESSETVRVGLLKNVTTNNFAGGVASVVSGTSTAQKNFFTFEEGSSQNAVGGQAVITAGISSEEDKAQANENKLVLNKGTSEKSFTGGAAVVSGTGTAKVLGNEVELTEATSESGTITGATASAEGGVSDAQENKVTIAGGTYNVVNGAQSITGNGSAQSLSNVTTMTTTTSGDVSADWVYGGSSAIVTGTALAQDY